MISLISPLYLQDLDLRGCLRLPSLALAAPQLSTLALDGWVGARVRARVRARVEVRVEVRARAMHTLALDGC